MNIDTRLRKLEAEAKTTDPNCCQCPDQNRNKVLVLDCDDSAEVREAKETEFLTAQCCVRCGKLINFATMIIVDEVPSDPRPAGAATFRLGEPNPVKAQMVQDLEERIEKVYGDRT